MTWPSPLADAIPKILARRGSPVCVLASGDPFFYGVGTLLGAHVGPQEMQCFPAPSAFSLAAARLNWSLQDCCLMSLHGREFERIIPALQPRAKILCLSWDETTPPRLAKLLCERGLGQSRIVVMEAMGGPRERVRASTAEAFRHGGNRSLEHRRARNCRNGAIAHSSSRKWSCQFLVRNGRPAHQAGGPRRYAVVAGAKARRAFVGCRRGIRIDRDRMAAQRSRQPRDQRSRRVPIAQA